MMASLAQNYTQHPGALQHPGVAQGHPMGAMPHNPGQQGQPGPGMGQQMHMAVSGPGGPQVSQAMMGGMPPGAGPSAHALQHLNPGQAQQAQQIYQQQQAMFATNPALHLQQQQLIQQQRRQAMMASQYSGVPVGMPNGMNQMSPAQYQAMRGAAGPMARPVNLPQHLQQAQQQAQHSLEQQQAAQAQHQAQAHHQHQQQLMVAQQLAMQQQANSQAQGANNGQQQGPMNPQQLQNLQQAQIAAAQQHHQQVQAQAAHAAQQSQNQAQAQPIQQQAHINPQGQPQPGQPQPQQQAPGLQQQQQQAVAAAMLQQQQQRQGEKLKGQCSLKMMQFSNHLSEFGVSSRPLQAYVVNGAQRVVAQGIKQKDDLSYWLAFVERFFSGKGVLRHSVWDSDLSENKQYEVTYPALPRYFHTHHESGVKNMQMIMEKGTEKELPNNGHYIESQKSSFVYWFDNGSQVIAHGTLRVHFDAEQKIELMEFETKSHEEYLPRSRISEAAGRLEEWQREWHKVNAPLEGKQSPEMNKKKLKMMKSPPQPPPEFDMPPSKVKPSMGITPSVFRFFEMIDVMVQMNPLFSHYHSQSSLSPYKALEHYVTHVSSNGNNIGGPQNPSGPRTPGLPNFPLGASPAAAHLQLPGGSPHMSGSPNQAPGMQLQQSQHGTSSSGPSANTSPNVNNKRRRPSAVKAEDDNQVNGTQGKNNVKPSPRIGGKRQKGNPA